VEAWLRTLLLVGGGLCVFGLIAAVFFCAGLSDIVKWTSCDTLLALASRGERTIFRLLAEVWQAVAGR
jgi:hypothetical protein